MMQTVRTTTTSVVAASIFYGVAPTPSSARTQSEITIEVVNRPRPVSYAVRQVEKHFGYVVTYEDTDYRFPDDIIDVSKQMKMRPPSAGYFPGMRNGSIYLRHSPRASTLAGQVGEVLQEIVARSRRAGNIGAFQVQPAVNGYHVVPVRAKNQKGVDEPYESPLESRITMESRDETAADMLGRLVDVVSQASGQRVGVGLMPGRLLATRVKVDARNDKARDVLWRTLQSIHPGLSWQMLCGPDTPCALNIHWYSAPLESVTPTE